MFEEIEKITFADGTVLEISQVHFLEIVAQIEKDYAATQAVAPVASPN